MNYLGIDIGGTAVKFGIVTDAGEILYRKEYPVAFDHYATPILDTVQKRSREFLQDYAKRTGDEKDVTPGGIGVSATGQIDSVNGVVAGVGGNIANWQGSPIKAVLEAEYQVPVSVLNDANCAVLAEVWTGRAKGCRQVVMVTIGTGVGGGIITDGTILTGAHGFAGELGHFMIDRKGRHCTCGNCGCYEQYASMTALIRSVREQWPAAGSENTGRQAVNGRMIFELAEQGDPVITGIVAEWIADIAAGLISFIHLFNPELVLLGGGVSAQETLFIEPLRARVMAGVMDNFRVGLELAGAALKNDAGMIGAVYYLKQQLENDLLKRMENHQQEIR